MSSSLPSQLICTEALDAPKIYTPIGLDFGTSNSVISNFIQNSLYSGARIYHLPVTGDELFPSVLYFDKKQSKFIVGKGAVSKRILDPENTIASIKRKICTKEYYFNDEKFSPTELISKIINSMLCEVLSIDHNLKVKHIAVTVPYYFSENENFCIQESARKAFLNAFNCEIKIHIIPEPVAAAISYLESIKNKGVKKKTILVFDIGGGTLDLTLVDLSIGRDVVSFEVIGNEGINHFGGDDVDNIIFDYIIKREKIDLSRLCDNDKKKDIARILCESIEAKHHLSIEDSYSFVVSNLRSISDGVLDTIITKKQLGLLLNGQYGNTRNMVLELRSCLKTLFNKTHIDPNKIDITIPIGGTTQIPVFSEIIGDMCPQSYVYIEEGGRGRFTAVARGAAIYSAIKSDEIDHTNFAPFGSNLKIGRFITRINHPLFIRKYNGSLDCIVKDNAIAPKHIQKIYSPTRFYPDSDIVQLDKVDIVQGCQNGDFVDIGSINFSNYEIHGHGKDLTDIKIYFELDVMTSIINVKIFVPNGNANGTDISFIQTLHI